MLKINKMSNPSTIKITFKAKDSTRSFYIMKTESWLQLVQYIEANLKDVEINKLRKFWIGEFSVFFLQIVR